MGEDEKQARSKSRAKKEAASPAEPKIKAGRLQRAWQQMPQIAGAAALVAGGVFFVGWQYKQSLALAFGLSAYPGDMSFQSTVATGVTVFNTVNTFLVAGAFWGAFALGNLVRAIPDLLRSWSTKVATRQTELNDEVNRLKSSSDADPKLLSSPEFRAKVIEAAKKNKSGIRERKFLLAVLNSTVATAIIMMLSSIVLVGTGLILLFQTGNDIAISDARAIRVEARGRCDGCFLYDTEPVNLLGVPVFQSADAIYVQEYDGLYRVELSKLKSIKPYWRVTGKPLTDPRR